MCFRKVAVVAASCLVLTGGGMAMSNDLVSEVEELRVRNKSPKIDISEIAKKYVPVGTNKQTAIKYFEDHGFKIFYPRPREPGTETLTARMERRGIFRFANDEIRINVYLRDDAATEVRGWLFLHTL